MRIDRTVRIGIVRQDMTAAKARERRLANKAARSARHRNLDRHVSLDESAHNLASAIGGNATRHGQQDRRQPILGDYASGVSHAILSAAISSRAIVR